jgi:hypothetical protein
MSSTSKLRSRQSTLSPKADTRAKMYSIAAAAAGVSMLALAQPADAEVVVTRKTIPIPLGSYDGTQYPVPIDLNHDGINDFSFSLSSFAYHSFNGQLDVTPLQGGAVVGAEGQLNFYASALARGAKVGPSAHFSSKGRAFVERSEGADYDSMYSRKVYGKWGGDPANRYVGVRFLINGETHYGWVRLTANFDHRLDSATITAYAYETVANKRILAGENATAEAQPNPLEQGTSRASLGMLALGANGLALWRREETSTLN